MISVDDGAYGEPGGPDGPAAGPPGGPAAEVEVLKEPRSILKQVVVTVFKASLVLGAVYYAVQVAAPSSVGAIKRQALPCL